MPKLSASKLREIYPEGFSNDTLRRRRNNDWKEGIHYVVCNSPNQRTPRYLYNIEEIEKWLTTPAHERKSA